MEICVVCRAPIPDAEVIWRTQQTCKQTMSSPAEYEEQPLCVVCDDATEERVAYHEEQRALRGCSDEERERV